MKKVVLTSLFLLSMFVCSSQIDTFRMNGKTYCLWADTNYGRRTNALEVVCVNTFNNIRPDRFLYTEKEKTGNYITITINSYQIDEFRDFLVKMRNKYEEWSIVAKENNVTSLYKKYPCSNILKRAIGYKELISYLNNEITLDEAKELIKKNTRHYAKRQYTWFNNQINVKWFNQSNTLINDVNQYISELNSI